MRSIRNARMMLALELALTVIAAVVVTFLVIRTGIIDKLALNWNSPEGDLADLGPGLLVLASGLGIMALRRWRESERERVAHDAASKARLRSEARYHSLVEVSPDPVLVVREKLIDYVNPAAVSFFGASDKSELLGLNVLELLPAELREGASAWFDGVLTTGEPLPPFEQPLLRLDGKTVAAETAVVRTPYSGGFALQAVVRDLTARRAADEAVAELRDSEARYRGLIEMSPSPVIVYDMDRTIVFANNATLELMRAKDMSEVLGKDARTFIHVDSRQGATERREHLEREGSSLFTDVRIVRCDGSPVAIQMATNQTTYAGAVAYQVVLQDVSRLKDEALNLKRTTENTISAMARLAEVRDPYTSGHQERVAAIAFRIAQRMGLPDATCDTIRLAGVVHDIGKMNVPAEILSKPGRLTDAEFSLIQEHAEKGYELLLPIEFPWPIAEIVREHHERINGSGYPRGLEDGAICIEARVIAVADTVEAMSAHRPYRPALGLDAALVVIRDGRGHLYDPRTVDAALELAAEGTLLEAGTGARASVWSAA